MKIRLLITLSCVLFLSDGVLAEGENEIKKDIYPFMAFIYYPDETVVEPSGNRFLRGAVLVKPEWLISSTVGPMMINDVSQGFPRKTLMARLGAVSIDANFTLNEDEDEQEREVIQIVRPFNYSTAVWWHVDISLLKTLLPFKLTSAVGVATIRSKRGIANGNCFILVFAKRFGNLTDHKTLTQLFVELQPPSVNICGQHFNPDVMLCATDSDENKNYDPDFCLGNSGGPLVCENEITGIQTYVDNNCKQPHLYQLLSAWDNFITCGIEDKCNEENCGHMCMLINKDEPFTEELTPPEKVDLVSAETSASSTTVTEEITIPIRTSSSTEMMIEDEDIKPPHTLSTAADQSITVETTTATTTLPTTSTPSTERSTLRPVSDDNDEETSWPKEKISHERMKNFEDEVSKIERKTNVEAQRHGSQELKAKKARKGSAERNVCVFQRLFTFCVLVSLIVG